MASLLQIREMRQKTPDACGETPTLSESLNQNSAVCLPLVSDSQKLIWVHSNQINLQMDGAAELDKAFDRFPYLTQKQTAVLAQRCSLHPDQVKVWFMVQRLRYGISWDYKDIRNIRRKFHSSWGKVELQDRKGEEVKEDTGENKQRKRGARVSSGKKAGEVREEQSAKGRMMNKEKDREVEEDKRKTQKKRKGMTVTDKMGKKRMKKGVVERAGEVERESTKSDPAQLETTLFTRKEMMKAKANKRLLSSQEWPADKSFVVPDEHLDASPLLTPLSQTQAFDEPPLTDNQTPGICMTPVKSRFEGKTENNPVVADGCSRYNPKTQTQLAMMRAAFSHCQYPDMEEYNRLVTLIGVPRRTLVQWFGDMRYYIKGVKPSWLNQEQHSQALANIMYRQWLNALAKAQPSGGWMKKLDRSENNGDEEGVQVPTEGNEG
ncbi:homeobox and leucine zipper encoding b [Enoplosus armatus]|uniref:homeobox and leucine zipper encoding b n=1 Tax=Enoplosus armatus TaxID=215367 RepID=UPI0039924F66